MTKPRNPDLLTCIRSSGGYEERVAYEARMGAVKERMREMFGLRFAMPEGGARSASRRTRPLALRPSAAPSRRGAAAAPTSTRGRAARAELEAERHAGQPERVREARAQIAGVCRRDEVRAAREDGDRRGALARLRRVEEAQRAPSRARRRCR